MVEQRKGSPAFWRRASLGVRVAAPAVALATVLTGCVGGGDGGEGGDDGGGSGNGGGNGGGTGDGAKPIASTDETVLKFSAKTEIMQLQRTQDDMVFLSFRITNTGDEPGEIFSELATQADTDGASLNSPSGVSLIDPQGMKHYLPQSYSNKDCYCKLWDNYNIEPGKSLETWVVYPAPPKNVKKLSVDIPTSPAIFDVPLSSGGEVPEDPSGKLAKPRVLDLRQIEEDLEDGTARDENNDETNVMLSSDVLFELNKSDLTSKADSSLKKVAEEIDESSAKTVKVDGYTDNSGDDSINQPLSEDRASEVTKKLKELVKRKGIEFKPAGHGSSDPVASNDTDDGRQKNRRVSVRFAK
ncbi:outer membrane protein OmpA-like peptidoglycan-associated protein [Murinocardiopsis flavida]|uniref:Outer membrane protein OmpA-like peptidoglycan-associated protein n=1 Tax=Murinocardiopsis flavida TaxID=645275 RepID=A0A2P8D282_9ACTN|nr:OmpA family protein [Murinocardiopsis flavida]PSK91309.1 outer membrane protein OmpA-like peptidoglycan-associated protein [Murinocardiopsis flavida]